ncbi:hypothetical protein FKP32DRAFT_1676556 [Trametes sanguinea]|nr:hypothetical protein FKP32DRAFT_1676556 [Trametes sanguinea]
MPSVRTPLKCSKPVLKLIDGLMFSADKGYQVNVSVPTAQHPTHDGAAYPCFPSFEMIFGADITLHETWVTLSDDVGREHRFLIAAQHCSGCEINRSLNGVLPGVNWRGELIVMYGGRRSFVVNMKRADLKQLARLAVRKFLAETAPLVAHALQNDIPLVVPVAYQA